MGITPSGINWELVELRGKITNLIRELEQDIEYCKRKVYPYDNQLMMIKRLEEILS